MGFTIIEIDAAAAVDPRRWAEALDDVSARMLARLGEARNVLVCTARGPDDPAIPRLNAALAAGGADAGRVDAGAVHARIGSGLGELVRRARLELGIPRAIFSGGDTSGHATLALGAEALLPVCPIANGAPLLEIRSADAAFDGMEIALKGGQMGADDFFLAACGQKKS